MEQKNYNKNSKPYMCNILKKLSISIKKKIKKYKLIPEEKIYFKWSSFYLFVLIYVTKFNFFTQ